MEYVVELRGLGHERRGLVVRVWRKRGRVGIRGKGFSKGLYICWLFLEGKQNERNERRR